jgi:hypothetical protein
MVKRTLPIITVILIVFIIAEAVYFFMMSPNNPLASLTPQPVSVQMQATPTPAPLFSPALDEKQLEWFKQTRSTAHISSLLHQEYRGKIHKITSHTDTTSHGDVTEYSLYLTDDRVTDESMMNIFNITSDILSQVSVVDTSSGTESPIAFTDLATGDRVTVRIISDITKNSGSLYQQFDIVKTQ